MVVQKRLKACHLEEIRQLLKKSYCLMTLLLRKRVSKCPKQIQTLSLRRVPWYLRV